MSMVHEVRINALEARVTALEKRLLELEPPEGEQRYRAVHKGFGRWFAMAPDGETTVNHEPMTKGQAQNLADEMNAQTEGLSAA